MSIDYAKARRLLARRDPVLGELMRQHGACGLAHAQHEHPFRALVHAIIAQQLSTKAAATIERRVSALFAGPASPEALASVTDTQLRAAGMSFQKIRYLRDLCARVQDGSLDLELLPALSDEDVIEKLHAAGMDSCPEAVPRSLPSRRVRASAITSATATVG